MAEREPTWAAVIRPLTWVVARLPRLVGVIAAELGGGELKPTWVELMSDRAVVVRLARLGGGFYALELGGVEAGDGGCIQAREVGGRQGLDLRVDDKDGSMGVFEVAQGGGGQATASWVVVGRP